MNPARTSGVPVTYQPAPHAITLACETAKQAIDGIRETCPVVNTISGLLAYPPSESELGRAHRAAIWLHLCKAPPSVLVGATEAVRSSVATACQRAQYSGYTAADLLLGESCRALLSSLGEAGNQAPELATVRIFADETGGAPEAVLARARQLRDVDAKVTVEQLDALSPADYESIAPELAQRFFENRGEILLTGTVARQLYERLYGPQAAVTACDVAAVPVKCSDEPQRAVMFCSAIADAIAYESRFGDPFFGIRPTKFPLLKIGDIGAAIASVRDSDQNGVTRALVGRVAEKLADALEARQIAGAASHRALRELQAIGYAQPCEALEIAASYLPLLDVVVDAKVKQLPDGIQVPGWTPNAFGVPFLL